MPTEVKIGVWYVSCNGSEESKAKERLTAETEIANLLSNGWAIQGVACGDDNSLKVVFTKDS